MNQSAIESSILDKKLDIFWSIVSPSSGVSVDVSSLVTVVVSSAFSVDASGSEVAEDELSGFDASVVASVFPVSVPLAVVPSVGATSSPAPDSGPG